MLNFSSPFANNHFGCSLCRTFKYKDDVKAPRAYSSILGCLVRKHFPGFVDLPTGGKSIAWTWRHYKLASDLEAVFENAQHRVLCDFFVSFFDFSSFNKSEVDNTCTNDFVHPCRSTFYPTRSILFFACPWLMPLRRSKSKTCTTRAVCAASATGTPRSARSPYIRSKPVTLPCSRGSTCR
jgi:hypothetical protein